MGYFIPNRLSYPACGVGEEGIGRHGGEEKGERREMEQDNEVEVNDITVHFKGDGRREEEGGVRRKGARRGSKM